MRSIALKGTARNAYNLRFIEGLEGDVHPRRKDALALLGDKNKESVDPLLEWRLQAYRFF